MWITGSYEEEIKNCRAHWKRNLQEWLNIESQDTGRREDKLLSVNLRGFYFVFKFIIGHCKEFKKENNCNYIS